MRAGEAALWEAGCRSVRRTGTGMEGCEVAVVETGRWLGSDPRELKGEPETDPLGRTEWVKHEGEACVMALPVEGGPWAAWGRVVEAAGTERRFERVEVDEAGPAVGNEVRAASVLLTG